MIKISKLPLIKSAEQFFDTDKVLMIDLLDLGPSDEELVQNIGDSAFSYRERIYLPVITSGSPENFFLNCRNGIPFSFTNGLSGLYKWDGDLKGAITDKKVYDFTNYHRSYKAGKETISREPQFIVDRYIKPLQAVTQLS